jgi:hypothetical protein
MGEKLAHVAGSLQERDFTLVQPLRGWADWRLRSGSAVVGLLRHARGRGWRRTAETAEGNWLLKANGELITAHERETGAEVARLQPGSLHLTDGRQFLWTYGRLYGSYDLTAPDGDGMIRLRLKFSWRNKVIVHFEPGARTLQKPLLVALLGTYSILCRQREWGRDLAVDMNDAIRG